MFSSNQNSSTSFRINYFKNKLIFKIVSIFVAAFIATIGITLLISVVRLLPGGTTGISFIIQGWLDPDKKIITFYLIFALINIPVLMFGFWKIGIKFALLSSSFTLFQLFWGFIFTLIPFFNIENNSFINLFNIQFKENNFQSSYRTIWKSSSWIIFIVAILGGFFYGLSVGICYKVGGSTGGSDIINTWFAKRKGKSIGFYLSIFNISIMILGAFIDLFLNKKINFLKTYASPIFLASILYTIIGAIIVNKIFPKYKKVQIQVISTNQKIKKIIDSFQAMKFHKGYTILDAVGGYTLQNKKVLLITVSVLELETTLEKVKNIDKAAFINVLKVHKISGRWIDTW